MPGQSLPTGVLVLVTVVLAVFFAVFILGLIAGAW